MDVTASPDCAHTVGSMGDWRGARLVAGLMGAAWLMGAYVRDRRVEGDEREHRQAELDDKALHGCPVEEEGAGRQAEAP